MGNRKAKSSRDSGRLTLWASIALMSFVSGPVWGGACQETSVSLRGDWGKARFSVEIADDDGERAQGLMFRDAMPVSAGMLFIYDYPQSLSFWMRNTLIPLDLLFIDSHGVVQYIHHDAIPGDETAIDGGENLLSVLEINGGLARRMGITEGTELRHPAFAGRTPAWPC